jgi:hypothetical protein
MHVKSRSSVSFNAQKTPTVKNWVIGWTLTEANAAAQRKRSDDHSPAKSGMFGTLVSIVRR